MILSKLSNLQSLIVTDSVNQESSLSVGSQPGSIRSLEQFLSSQQHYHQSPSCSSRRSSDVEQPVAHGNQKYPLYKVILI